MTNLKTLSRDAPSWTWSAVRFGAGWAYVGTRGMSVVSVRRERAADDGGAHAARWVASQNARVVDLSTWLITNIDGDLPVPCVHGGTDVPQSRRVYEFPTCYACLAPPASVAAVSRSTSTEDARNDAISGLSDIGDRLARSGFPDERATGRMIVALVEVIRAADGA